MTETRDNDLLRRQTLDLLRFPLAVVVLTIHIWTSAESGPTVRGETFNLTGYPIFTAINYFIDGFLRGQSVPIYFFISGYVFFYRVDFNREIYIKKLKNRIKTLLIPYLVWNGLAIIEPFIIWSIPLFKRFLASAEHPVNFTLTNVLSCFWGYDGQLFNHPAEDTSYPINIALWFLRNLMLLVICAPILYRLLVKGKHWIILLFGVCWFPTLFATSALINQLATSLFFFAWGAYMSIYKKDMLAVFGRYFTASAWLYLLLAVVYIVAAYLYPQICPAIKRLNTIAGLLFAYNSAAWLLQKGYCRIHSGLAASAFFIYVSHLLITGKILKIFYVLLKPTSDLNICAIYLLTTIASVATLLGIFYLLRRYAPNVLKVIAGRK